MLKQRGQHQPDCQANFYAENIYIRIRGISLCRIIQSAYTNKFNIGLSVFLNNVQQAGHFSFFPDVTIIQLSMFGQMVNKSWKKNQTSL